MFTLKRKYTVRLVSSKFNTKDNSIDGELTVTEKKTGKVDKYHFTTWNGRLVAEPWNGYFGEAVDELAAHFVKKELKLQDY